MGRGRSCILQTHDGMDPLLLRIGHKYVFGCFDTKCYFCLKSNGSHSHTMYEASSLSVLLGKGKAPMIVGSSDVLNQVRTDLLC